MRHIFISYSSKDRDLVNELAADIELLLDDYAIWFDRELNRSGGHKWWNLICAEIRRCDVFIYALSPQVLKSEACKREYAYARALGKPVLPIILADVEIRYLPVELQAAQLVNFRQRSREQQRSLKQSLQNMPTAPDLPSNAEALAPDAPLDPVGVLFDRIARLTTDADQQRLLIFDIEDLSEEEIFQKFVPDLLVRLLDRDDVLTGRNVRRVEELRNRLMGITSSSTPNTPATLPSVWTGFIQSAAPASTKPTPISLMPTPFAWIDIPNKDFSIAKYPVTNAQFAKFIEADGYNQENWWTKDGWAQRKKDKWAQPRYWSDKQWNGAEQPVVGVSWYEAIAFCLWLSETTDEKITLPTEDQWQYAAQGDDGRAYPWGNNWDSKLCNNNVDKKGIGKTTPVRQYEGKGNSPFGVVDMAGNVWEWCLTDYDNKTNDINSTANTRVLRGGSWLNDSSEAFRCVNRNRYGPFNRHDLIGFRVSRFK